MAALATTPETAAVAPRTRGGSYKPENPNDRPFLSRFTALRENLPALLLLFLALIAVALVAWTLPGVWLLLGVLALGGIVSLAGEQSHQQTARIVLAVGVALTSVDYLTWRFEVANWSGWWIAIPLFAAEAFGAIHCLGLQYTVWPWPAPSINATEDATTKPIFVFIPTVDEGVMILDATVRAALQARSAFLREYPHGSITIAICNDGKVAGAPDWQATERLAERLGVKCITRTVGGGAKAGNIEHARHVLGATGDALIVIFDADQQAHRDFFLKTIPPLGDPTIGWVQTGQYYRNLDNPVARWAHDQQALFYQVLCPGKAAHNAAFICGTNVVIRASALDEIGGLPQNSVTEDFAASIMLHRAWRSIFLTDKLAEGLGPMDLAAYFKQQRRWAVGTLSVLRTSWRDVFVPRRGGLKLEQRLQYALACTHYLCGVRDFIYLVAPLLFIITGIPAVRGSTLVLFLWHFAPYMLVSQAAFWNVCGRKSGWRGIVIGFGSFPVLIEAALVALLGIRISFGVTAKQRSGKRHYAHLLAHALAALACVGGFALALHTSGDSQAMFVSVLWVGYSLAMLLCILWLGMLDYGWQVAHLPVALGNAVSTRLKQNIAATQGRLTSARAASVSMASVTLLALLASGCVSSGATRAQTIFLPTLSSAAGGHPVFGMAFSSADLRAQSAVVQRTTGLPLALVGRTQDIQDSFDTRWAQGLEAQREQPWITLQFGEPGGSPSAVLDASLPAITNGVHDSDINRWAVAIREYAYPVYLTILPEVDRNWEVSSAVANGGIPQDARRAWLHVRSVFAQDGATNAQWVWAPADPAHDSIYAPPLNSIDVVALTMFHYAHTTWDSPESLVTQVARRYPTKPLIALVSAEGASAAKVQWLGQVIQAVSAHPTVRALVYSDSSPNPHASAADNRQWSIESSPDVLHAVAAWRSSFGAPQPKQYLTSVAIK